MNKNNFTLSVIIPVYNEEKTIAEVINQINLLTDIRKKQIIVVNDCSTDKTKEILSKVKGIKLINHEINKGKGACIKTGLKYTTGDIIIIQDADLECDPKDFPKLINPILTLGADVVFGSRFLNATDTHKIVNYRSYLGNKVVTILSNFLSNLNLTDVTMCYKVFRKDVMKRVKLKENGFGFEAEFTAKVAKLRDLNFYEVAVIYNRRSYTEGKKLRLGGILKVIISIIKYNLID